MIRPAAGVKLIKNVRIPMADGVRLAADLYVPDDGRDDFAPTTPPTGGDGLHPYRKDEAPTPRRRPSPVSRRHGYILARVPVYEGPSII